MHTQTNKKTDLIICPMLWYSNWTDKKHRTARFTRFWQQIVADKPLRSSPFPSAIQQYLGPVNSKDCKAIESREAGVSYRVSPSRFRLQHSKLFRGAGEIVKYTVLTRTPTWRSNGLEKQMFLAAHVVPVFVQSLFKRVYGWSIHYDVLNGFRFTAD